MLVATRDCHHMLLSAAGVAAPFASMSEARELTAFGLLHGRPWVLGGRDEQGIGESKVAKSRILIAMTIFEITCKAWSL